MLKQFDDFDLDIQKTTVGYSDAEINSMTVFKCTIGVSLIIVNCNSNSGCCPPTGTGCLTLQFGGCDSVNAACIPQNRPSIEQPCR